MSKNKKIKIEMDMIHFTVMYHFLGVANEKVKQKEGLNYTLFQEALNEIDMQ